MTKWAKMNQATDFLVAIPIVQEPNVVRYKSAAKLAIKTAKLKFGTKVAEPMPRRIGIMELVGAQLQKSQKEPH